MAVGQLLQTVVRQWRTGAVADQALQARALSKDLWCGDDALFLKLMAADVGGLAAKLARETDPEKRARIQRSLSLIGNHVAVMDFSRLNVVEQRTQEVVLAVLQKAAMQIVRALLAAVGLG